jgi:urea transport system ATP-binding protein
LGQSQNNEAQSGTDRHAAGNLGLGGGMNMNADTNPDGLGPEPLVVPHPYAMRDRSPAADDAAAEQRASIERRRQTLLYLDGVSVSFDGFKAINNLSFVLADGEMRAIIGPNGAGKTTMMDIITGKTRPDRGDVYFNGDIDLTSRDEAEIATLGIGRKFQKPTVFEGHSVEDNIALALAGSRGVMTTLFHRQTAEGSAKISGILETIRLEHLRGKNAAGLSHGQKQWLEIGMLLAQDPKLLLVDEPVAGMTDAETEETARLLREIAVDHSVVVVEHDMDFVRELDVKVTCLHEGSVLSEGTLDHVSADDRVIEVYLGR